jgi:hypothetical protein
MHLYTHSRADWHSGISERRRRERISLTLVRSFFSPSISYAYTHLCQYIYICPRIEHLFHFSHGQCIVIDEYEYITQMEEQTSGSSVMWSKKKSDAYLKWLLCLFILDEDPWVWRTCVTSQKWKCRTTQTYWSAWGFGK